MSRSTVIAAVVAGILTTGVVGAAIFSDDTPEAVEPVQETRVQEVEGLEEETVPALDEIEEENEKLVEVEEAEEESEEPVRVVPAEPKTEPKPVAPAPKPAPACSCPVADVDCPDLGSHANAQAVYECCMDKYGYDYHRLDRDKDGLACESN